MIASLLSAGLLLCFKSKITVADATTNDTMSRVFPARLGNLELPSYSFDSSLHPELSWSNSTVP